MNRIIQTTLLVMLVALGSTGLRAQNVLVALEGDKPVPVVAFEKLTPFIERDGKLRQASLNTLSLQPAKAYGSGMVAIGDWDVHSEHQEFVGSPGSFNFELVIKGHLRANMPLSQCFLVLEFMLGEKRSTVALELPDLVPDRDASVSNRVRLVGSINATKLRAHFFSAGVERLHSKMPAAEIAKQKAKTQELMQRTPRTGPQN